MVEGIEKELKSLVLPNVNVKVIAQQQRKHSVFDRWIKSYITWQFQKYVDH